ncbi:DUF805 domain-containing protein [Streptomyces thermogriseus]|uniref:DUF805 domain-containing protein n=1 Tax=Streptomyces thermogriseus TaxID=75292 RepID=A0ABP4DBZ8_9ACTN
MYWYLEVLKKYAVFSGRARRREYWMFFLVNFIVGLVLAVIGQVLDLEILQYLYSLAVLLPGLGVAVRRLHDTGRSGWWLLIALVPLIGAIVLLVFLVSDSQPDTNQYGPNPKTAVA